MWVRLLNLFRTGIVCFLAMGSLIFNVTRDRVGVRVQARRMWLSWRMTALIRMSLTVTMFGWLNSMLLGVDTAKSKCFLPCSSSHSAFSIVTSLVLKKLPQTQVITEISRKTPDSTWLLHVGMRARSIFCRVFRDEQGASIPIWGGQSQRPGKGKWKGGITCAPPQHTHKTCVQISLDWAEIHTSA